MKRQPKCLARSRPSAVDETYPYTCERLNKRTIHANLALKLQVTLISNDNNGERVLILDSENLLVKRADFLERVPRCDRVDE